MATATMPYGLLAMSPRLVAVVSPRGRLYRVTVDEEGQAVRRPRFITRLMRGSAAQ